MTGPVQGTIGPLSIAKSNTPRSTATGTSTVGTKYRLRDDPFIAK
jgi:hypothetical protein